VELEAGDRKRDCGRGLREGQERVGRERGRDWVRIGGRSLRGGQGLAAGSSVADLAGEGGIFLLNRGASGWRKAALWRCTFAEADFFEK